jgi:nicotinamide mononucleotide (NMN) deamidase PncC
MQLIEEIHNSPIQFVVAVSGGGSDAISQLLQVPGASRTLLESVIPYSPAAMTNFLGTAPDQACSEKTARAMAMSSYLRARRLQPDADVASLAGISCTAALTTDRQRKGLHSVHVGIQTCNSTQSISVQLGKGLRSRHEEESIACNLILNAIAKICGCSQQLPVDLTAEERVIHAQSTADDDLQALFTGQIDSLRVIGKQQTDAVKTVLPGAFNPLHDGHRQIARLAAEITGQRTHLEICTVNVDKLPLDYLEMEYRIQHLAQEYPLWFTRAPTFVEKASLFPGATFAVGIDTIIRIADPRYYDDESEKCLASIDAIAEQDCKFLVFGREIEGTFLSLDDVTLPDSLREMCEYVPENNFRVDISSTAIRQKTNHQSM